MCSCEILPVVAYFNLVKYTILHLAAILVHSLESESGVLATRDHIYITETTSAQIQQGICTVEHYIPLECTYKR